MSVVFIKDTDVIHLPSPEFGDSESLQLRAPVGVSMDGSFYSYIKTPIQKVLNMSFAGLTRFKMEEFVTFLIDNQGSQIKFVDVLGVTWQGYITTDPNEFTTDGRGRGTSELKEDSSINIVFEGEKI